jgi:hypothetical protein
MGSAPPGLTSLPIPSSRALGFQVLRHGTAIGNHTLEFRVNGDDLEVEVLVDAVLYLGPIRLMRYTHRLVETWRGGRLTRLLGRTDRNGAEEHMSALRTAAGLRVEGSGTEPYIAPEDALPTTYWNARMLRGPMIGTQDGGLVRPMVTAKGTEPVRLASGQQCPARCYGLTGDLDLDLWYGDADDWMGMRFAAVDGSMITYARL